MLMHAVTLGLLIVGVLRLNLSRGIVGYHDLL